MKILTNRRAAVAAAAATAALAIGAPAAADASPAHARLAALPISATCPQWYGLYSIAGLGCLSWFQVWLLSQHAYPFARTTTAATP
jgi:hypothetical protein